MTAQTVQIPSPYGSTVARAERLLASNGTTQEERQALASYEGKIFAAMQFYQIPQSAYFVLDGRKPDEIVTGTTIIMLHDNNTPPEFLDSPENALFALAIGNSWVAAQANYTQGLISAEQLQTEKQSLVSVLQSITFRNQHAHLPAIGEPAGPSQQLFSQLPPRQRSSLIENRGMSIYDCIARFEDPQASGEWRGKIQDPNGPMFHHYKFMRGRHMQPVHIHALTIAGEELAKRTGGGIAWFMADANGNRHIVLANDAETTQLQHEMGHHLFAQLVTGNPPLLFDALDEAWTENAVYNPGAYSAQRAVLRILLEDSDIALSMATFYRTGMQEHRERFLSILVKKYGLQGFLQIARMNAMESNAVYGMATNAKGVEKFLRYINNTRAASRHEQETPIIQMPYSEDEMAALDFLIYLQNRQ